MDENDAIQSYLRDGGPEGGANNFFEREIDQGDKADDAVDYENISDDDDLPDEETATHRLEDTDDVNTFLSQEPSSFDGLPTQRNGHHDAKEPASDELFGGTEEINDLFGEHTSSPEQERQPQSNGQPPPPRLGGLALPSKSGLALPGYSGTYQQVQQQRPLEPQYSPESMSPPSMHDDIYARTSPARVLDFDDLEGETDKAVLEQRRLMRAAKLRQQGEEVEDERVEVDMETFYSLFPGYEADENPRFTELFPPKLVAYKGKLPPKPPKPVQPTKLSLDILQDQAKSFKSAVIPKVGEERAQRGMVYFDLGAGAQEDSDDDLSLSNLDEYERIGGNTMHDLTMICEDWELPSVDSSSDLGEDGGLMDGEWEAEERARPAKKQKTSTLHSDLLFAMPQPQVSYEDPERAVAMLAKAVALDLNDPNLLIDEHAPQTKRRTQRVPGDIGRDPALNRDLVKRYNISNDEAYDLLKENHQHKIRSTLGAAAIEHSLPATKLQYPFYKVDLDVKSKRSFHRPSLDLRYGQGKEHKFQRPKTIKRKERRGREVKDLFSNAESLSHNDNSSVILLEYSEEAPLTLSNFGMGNKLINYYRKRNADDQDRPKREIGDTHVLLTQDKSPFQNFGHVDSGEVVPTIQNGLYRAPVFQHQPKSTDFLIGVSTTWEYGSRLYLRNVENLHTVGQQFPIAEVPGEHSRRVTDAAKKRLRAISYRILTKQHDPARKDKVLDNHTVMVHLKGHDMPQTRSKMREFMRYERLTNKDSGVWVPLPGQAVPDADTLRSWVKPEDVCLLDSMQMGVQHLADLGIKDGKEVDDEKDMDDTAHIEKRLAPWRTTKNFLSATQGKAMLELHGEGDPTGRGEGFSFVKTSMKGGFQPLGESVEDKIDAKKRRDNGGHNYNVARQQKAYDDHIRMVWDKQKQSLSNDIEMSDYEVDDELEHEPDTAYPYGRAGTPRSSVAGTPAVGRHDDETATQFSRGSVNRGRRGGEILVIERKGRDIYGQESDEPVVVDDPRVIKAYREARAKKLFVDHFGGPDPELPESVYSLIRPSLHWIVTDRSRRLMAYEIPGKVPELDELVKLKIESHVVRIERNMDRRNARERQKGKVAASPSATVGSPGPSEAEGVASAAAAADASTDNTPQKGRGRNKDGTARKCANCGQVGHIKTNRKSVYTFRCAICNTAVRVHPGGIVREDQEHGQGYAASPASTSYAQNSFSVFEL